MARPLEFDKAVAMDAALNLFWRDGYEASTIQKLLAHMGINRGSLYSSFGDKQTLFIAALERYEVLLKERIAATLDKPEDPLQGIRDFMEKRFLGVDRRTLENGCLFVNTISELANTEPELAALASRKLQPLERALLKRLQQAAERKQLRSSQPPAVLRDYLMTVISGLVIRGKQSANKKQLRGVIDKALAGL